MLSSYEVFPFCPGVSVSNGLKVTDPSVRPDFYKMLTNTVWLCLVILCHVWMCKVNQTIHNRSLIISCACDVFLGWSCICVETIALSWDWWPRPPHGPGDSVADGRLSGYLINASCPAAKRNRLIPNQSNLVIQQLPSPPFFVVVAAAHRRRRSAGYRVVNNAQRCLLSHTKFLTPPFFRCLPLNERAYVTRLNGRDPGSDKK